MCSHHFCPHVHVFNGGIIFLGSGKCSVGCGKGATFPLVKQSVCNYICADCVQRKCVHRIRSLGDVAQILCVFACVCVCVCLCVCEPFVLQTREGCGRSGSFLLSQTLQRQGCSCGIL